jgi:hypothetical protein
MTTLLVGDVMATKRNDMPVRLGTEAIQAARKAAALKGLTLGEYATTVLLEAANRDLDEFAAGRVQAKKPSKKEGGSK